MQWKKTTKVNPKYQRNIVPNSAQNQPKIVPKSAQNGSKISSGADVASESVFVPILDRFFGPTWGHLGGQVGSMLGKKIDFWRFPKACKNDHDFQHSSGPSWDRFWNDFGVQNRTKIGPRSVSIAIMKQIRRSSKS